MKERLKIKNFNSILSIFGVALLLLLSPCKIRNFIQAELGIPQTEVLNKSKSVISQSVCKTFEISETIQIIFKPTIQQADFPFSEAYSFDPPIYSLQHSFTQGVSKSKQLSDVPLYILYQKIQVYS